ncbi:CGA synthase-related protein [Kitasatospora sp. NPDC058406]|uniref:CGA synthase-related protein n=1 Tax=Streptomycetaceae TaxID=2062 RepID=UPI002E76325F|nr:CGA synthase-related protein [Streptomyces sp. BE303]MED7953067.1 CGA synthase-related protein [Streptomyces sp. BE303]
MALLTSGPETAPPAAETSSVETSQAAEVRSAPHAPDGRAPCGPGVLLRAREGQLDSTLALRRVAAHLGDLHRVDGPDPDPPPVVALVCDDLAATERLLALGVPVVHLASGHPGPSAADAPPERALGRTHRPGWLPRSGPAAGAARPTGVLAPHRTGRSRTRSGTLLLLSLWGVPDADAEAFATGPLPQLADAALRRTGSCTVVADTGLDLLRSALEGRAERPGLRVDRASEVDPDALHAGAAVFLASPVLGVLALAQARRAPLTLLPPLGPAQRDLAARVAAVLPLPTAEDPDDPGLWEPSEATAAGPWHLLDPALDDLRGAQRVARTVRQLALAPP